MIEHRVRTAALSCAVMLGLGWLVGAAEPPQLPLHLRIDQLLEKDPVGPPVEIASDAEFLRRVSIDLSGMPPTPQELSQFLDDRDPEKRAKAIDRLLDGPLFVRQWATTLDVMWMERLPFEQVPSEKWEAFLYEAARRNRPIPELVAEILQTDGGGDPSRRTPARFYLDRNSEPNRIARDVGRLFLGRDMQCAQCHNHPLVDDYRQSDYQGLLAFFSPGAELVHMEGTKKTTFFPESAARDLTFDSVFVKNDHHVTGPRLPGGVELDEPAFPPGDEYRVKPAGLTMPVPRHSRRAMLARLIASGKLEAFNQNLANRLWAMMMGRGLVHPLDMNHPANPPIHPELMAMLGRELAAMNFDTKQFLHELARTRAYQRTSLLPESVPALSSEFTAALTLARSRTAEWEAAADRADQAFRSAEKDWHHAESALVPVVGEHEKALAAHESALKKADEARTAAATAESAAVSGRETGRVLTEAAARAAEAAKKLPKEKAITDAAELFHKRSAAYSTEQSALEKARLEKSAAAKKSAEDVTAAAARIESLRARIREVRATVRAAEAHFNEVRRHRAEARSNLENHRRRLATLEASGKWDELRNRLDRLRREREERATSLAKATRRAEDQKAFIGPRREELRKAAESRTRAEADHVQALADLDRRKSASSKIEEALSAIRSAMERLPDDPELKATARTLETKTKQIRASLAALADRVDQARSSRDRAAGFERSASEALQTAESAARSAEQEVLATRRKIEAERARIDALQNELAAASEELSTLLANRFAMAALRPLTPEQLYWSVLQVTGVYPRTRAAVAAQMAEVRPRFAAIAGAAVALIDEDASRTQEGLRDRALQIEQQTHAQLKSGLSSFIQIYGAGPGQPQGDFFATAEQALFTSNGGPINQWIAPAAGNVVQRMIAEADARKAAGHLYQTILSRPPTAPETDEVARLLAIPGPQKTVVAQELVWGLLTSAEFRFNH